MSWFACDASRSPQPAPPISAAPLGKNNMSHIPLSGFFQETPSKKIFRVRALPEVSPPDFNLRFLDRSGWSLSSDRFRFHPQQEPPPDDANELVKLMASRPPHILIRRLNKEEDYFVTISVFLDGKIEGSRVIPLYWQLSVVCRHV